MRKADGGDKRTKEQKKIRVEIEVIHGGRWPPHSGKQLTNKEWYIGIYNVYFSSSCVGGVVHQGYSLLTDIRESN